MEKKTEVINIRISKKTKQKLRNIENFSEKIRWYIEEILLKEGTTNDKL